MCVGIEISALLFGLNVDIFDSIIEHGSEYEISNVLVQDVKPQYLKDGQHKQELIIDDSTVVHKVNGPSSSRTSNNWFTLERLPRIMDPAARFDVGVVLHVEPPRTVSTFRMFGAQVCEIYVTDDSCDQTILISAWCELATTLYEKLKDVDSVNHVISFTFLKPSTFKGYSLGTTSITKYQIDAMDERADFLKEWCKINSEMVESLKMKAHSNQIVTIPIETASISEALSKKAEELHRGHLLKINVQIQLFKSIEVKLSVGCRICNRSCETEIGKEFKCHACSKMSTTQPKLYLFLKARSNSGSIQLAAFTRHVDQLLNTSASCLHSMSIEERTEFIDTASSKLCQGFTEMLIIPALSLLVDHKKVKWTL